MISIKDIIKLVIRRLIKEYYISQIKYIFNKVVITSIITLFIISITKVMRPLLPINILTSIITINTIIFNRATILSSYPKIIKVINKFLKL